MATNCHQQLDGRSFYVVWLAKRLPAFASAMCESCSCSRFALILSLPADCIRSEDRKFTLVVNQTLAQSSGVLLSIMNLWRLKIDCWVFNSTERVFCRWQPQKQLWKGFCLEVLEEAATDWGACSTSSITLLTTILPAGSGMFIFISVIFFLKKDARIQTKVYNYIFLEYWDGGNTSQQVNTQTLYKTQFMYSQSRLPLHCIYLLTFTTFQDAAQTKYV